MIDDRQKFLQRMADALHGQSDFSIYGKGVTGTGAGRLSGWNPGAANDMVSKLDEVMGILKKRKKPSQYETDWAAEKKAAGG